MANTPIEPATIKVDEAAKMLGIGRQLAYSLAREGKLPGARRLGRRLVVSTVLLEAFLTDGRADLSPAWPGYRDDHAAQVSKQG